MLEWFFWKECIKKGSLNKIMKEIQLSQNSLIYKSWIIESFTKDWLHYGFVGTDVFKVE